MHYPFISVINTVVNNLIHYCGTSMIYIIQAKLCRTSMHFPIQFVNSIKINEKTHIHIANISVIVAFLYRLLCATHHKVIR